MERWILATKRADFYGLANKLKVDPVTVRLMRNRGLTEETEMEHYLRPSLDLLHDPHLLKDADLAADIIAGHIRRGSRIMIANDFDCDGVGSGYILERAISKCGGDVYVDTPDRCKDGYGLNERLVREAADQGTALIVTCDNGIAAMEPVSLARKLGIEVIITDHHELVYEEQENGRRYLLPSANAIVNPKQPDCSYPYEGLCGAGVAFKLMQILYEVMGMDPELMYEYLEVAATATVADVMELKDENRILVKFGLEQMKHTRNLGLKALMEVNQIQPERLSAYHIGFVIGPCLNAAGRLDTAKKAIQLLKSETAEEAYRKAIELKELNDNRKTMTLQGTCQAMELIESSSLMQDRVLVVELKDCHESLAGIIAGRIREKYHKPVIVLTHVEQGLKGSGRSIPAYHMYEEVNRFRHLLTRFGGHAMACGLSIEKDRVEEFRQSLNQAAELTDEDLIPVVNIDVNMPIEYIQEKLIQELELLEPCGNGNPKPLFAQRGLHIRQAAIIGKNQNVLRLQLLSTEGAVVTALYFGDIQQFRETLENRYGQEQTALAFSGRENEIELLITYYPQINEYRGVRTIQLVIQNYDVPAKEI